MVETIVSALLAAVAVGGIAHRRGRPDVWGLAAIPVYVLVQLIGGVFIGGSGLGRAIGNSAIFYFGTYAVFIAATVLIFARFLLVSPPEAPPERPICKECGTEYIPGEACACGVVRHGT